MKNYLKLILYFCISLFFSFFFSSCSTNKASYYYVQKQMEHEDLNFHKSLRVNEYINAFDQPEIKLKSNELITCQIDLFYYKQNISYDKTLIQVALKTRSITLEETKSKFSLCFVLDVSGSMKFDDKLHIAKKALIDAVNILKNGDEFALVVFNNTAKTYIETQLLNNQSRILIINKLKKLIPGGGTNIQDGLLKGYFEMTKFQNHEFSRLLLLTDGNSNINIMSPERMSQKLNIEYIEGLRISTIGLGYDVDQKMLREIAQNGGGHFYFVDSYKTLSNIIKNDLNMVVVPLVKDLELKLNTDSNFKILNIFGKNEEDEITDSEAELLITELNADDWRIFVVEVEKQNNLIGNFNPLSVSLTYKEISSSKFGSINSKLEMEWYNNEMDINPEINFKVARNSVIYGNALSLIKVGELNELNEYEKALDILNIQLSNNLSYYEFTNSQSMVSEINRLYKIREILLKKTNQNHMDGSDIIANYDKKKLDENADSNKKKKKDTSTLKKIVNKGIEITEIVTPGPWVTLARLISQAIF